MSASRRANAARGGDGRTNPDSELSHRAMIQKCVVDLLRFVLSPNYTGKGILRMQFKDSVLVKVQTKLNRSGLGKFGEADLSQHAELCSNLQKHALKLFEWGTPTKGPGLWGEATLELLVSRGKVRPVTEMMKDEIIRSGKMAA